MIRSIQKIHRLEGTADEDRGEHMVRPLTKRTKKGGLYVRPPAVETAIRAALREDLDDVSAALRRSRIADRPNTSAPECLVHLRARRVPEGG